MRNPLLLKATSLFTIIALTLVPLLKATYLDEPVVLWSYQLPGSGTLAGPGLRKNNAVVATENYLFTTTDEGSLHLIPVSGGDGKHVEAPTLFGTSTECHSGASISYENDGDINFVVYAVQFSINIPNSGSDADYAEKTSRVVAVNLDGTIRWTQDFSGSIAGTPIANKNFVYVSVSNNDDGGKVVILRDQGTSQPIVAAEISSERTQIRRHTFGPLTLQVSSNGQNYLFWGDSSNDVSSEEEYFVYTLFPSSEFEANEGIGADSYIFKRFGVWNRTQITKPVVARDLSAIWMGGSDSAVSGWVDELELAGPSDPSSFNWQNTMIEPEMNPRKPMSTTMTLSSDDEFIFLTDNKVRLYCLRAKTGDIIWSNDGSAESGYSVQPILSEHPRESSMVYIIETMRGNVRQHDAATGEIIWEFNCNDLSQTRLCQHSVEAEFSLSPDDNVLYFGDIFGKITALQVANFDDPALVPVTEAPTATPTMTPTNPAPVELSSTITLPISTTLIPIFNSPTTAPKEVIAPTTDPKTADQEEPSPPTNVPLLETRPSAQPSKSQFQTNSPLDNIDNGLSLNEIANSASTASDKNSILLIALIVIFIGCALVALAFFFLILKKRRQEGKDDSNVIENKSTESMDAERQVEESSKASIASVVVINKRIPDMSTPKKRKNKKVIKTPATLESIEETPEDVSVVSSVNEGDNKAQNNLDYDLAPSLLSLETFSDPACNERELETSQNNKTGVTSSYLPKALSNTFDQVIKNVLDIGMINTKEDYVPEKSGAPVSGVSSTESSGQLSDFPEAARVPPPPVVRPLYSPPDSPPPPPPPGPTNDLAPETALPPYIDDTSSIGSGSLFLEEDDAAGSSLLQRSLSPFLSREEPSRIIPKSSTSEDLSIKKHDPWNKFMSSIIDAEQEFFNPKLPAIPKHKTKSEVLQDSPFDENKD
eukprot:CAMPEP_0194229954 /NCGR_PEP_ID=MMETSP0156-20130528/44156_1 /TAXON_ID=33649 /ORGANISM="Thalassionema nitzschioides, Strain L26-B" /LENGTH=937 /DNA_ID=CAMNT_0038962519 /DNA_START=13 /DNA_END=2826 /DNA_ORIENTATION=-